MQPDSTISRAVNDLLSDFCGGIRSLDATVQPQKLLSLTADVMKRSHTVIIIGGLDAISQEENTVFLLCNALGVPLERGKRSRSRFVYDTLRGNRLPSPQGAVLFPSRFDGPEGILLTAGEDTVLLLPGMRQAAVSIAVSMRKFLAPYAAKRYNASEVPTASVASPECKTYQKFQSPSLRKSAATRVYSESQLRRIMARAASGARRRDEVRYKETDAHDRQAAQEEADYRRHLSAGKARGILSLILVIGVIVALVVTAGWTNIS
jgi:hypothetical protein